MKSFLEQLSCDLYDLYGGSISDLTLVFPTRRAGLFFQKELASKAGKPLWSPKIFSIQDFILQFSSVNIPDDISLLFDLYRVYQKYFPDEDFDKFYPWGELLLKDFNDLDSYLVDSSKVFTTVNDLHEIDLLFELPEEQLQRLKSFWETFFGHSPTRLKNEFFNTWNHLLDIYNDFKKVLSEKNESYEGMAYRNIAEDMINGSFSNEKQKGTVVFAALYALSPAEETIVRHFMKNEGAFIYWDADSYYTNDSGQEAGKFFRQNKLIAKDFKWQSDAFATTQKNISIIGIPLVVGQAKYTGQLLDELIKGKSFNPEKTAVVLPDEKLLFPVLYSLPADLEAVNVTMGYPLNQTPLFDLFESLVALQRNVRKEKDDYSFYMNDVTAIVHHPYIRLASNGINSLDDFQENYIRISSKILNEKLNNDFLKSLFTMPGDIKDVFQWTKRILRAILESISDDGFALHKLESEFIYNFFTQINRLEDIFVKEGLITNIDSFWKIFREILSSVRVPFSGEPLKGLQLMGFLETRVLDFENLIVLSVNEDVLPAGGNKPSFIPFNIRKAFGLPTFEDQYAVSSYHFYRLLQRAANIHLIYNTEPSNLTGGEVSRFILQLKYELKKHYPQNIKIENKIVSTPIQKQEIVPIEVEKTEAILKRLEDFKWKSDDQYYGFSASSLQMYMLCPLKFYFNYIAGLKEQQEQEEHMEAATFGTVLHATMHKLYSDINVLNASIIKSLKTKVESVVDQSIKDHFVSIDQLEGKNILFRDVIINLVHRVLDSELSSGGVTLLELEKDVSTSFDTPVGAVKLNGIIDRVDRDSLGIRIIDYKTGKVDKRKVKEIEKLFADPSYKEQFQALYYAFLSKEKYKGEPIRSGLITVREMTTGVFYLNDSKAFSEEQYIEFMSHLKSLIVEIYNPEIPFSQTTDEGNCRYCPYADICNRKV